MALNGSIFTIPDLAVIKRGGNVPTGGNVTAVDLANPIVTNDDTITSDDTLMRAEVGLGNAINQNSINGQLFYSWSTYPGATGVALNGLHIAGDASSSVTYSTDEAANDGRGDGGEFYWKRGKAVTNDEYDAPTG